MAEALNKAISGIETPTPLKIGYAGCALGTSETRGGYYCIGYWDWYE
ncbi:hypothetical protein QFZ81_002007 [Paenibacillus sp. V4I9]|nr:hypothetical protein [Paenibacillus sp. V4I9]MDQ0886919.1 hypothetical protein [Paenibacillus sp. V4I9]